MGIFENMMRSLTESYTKNPNSNVGKLILLVSGQMEDLEETLKKVETWRDINQAEGATLDLLAENVGQMRGLATDEVLRILIRARVARNLSNGTMDGIINSLAVTLNTSADNIRIKELYDDPLAPEPAAIVITGLPIEVINQSGMTAVQFGKITQRVVASGVRVAAIDLSGTFSFSSRYDVSETDTATGFAPTTQATGGTLSGSFDPDDEIVLPI
ncbi:hypothetical protein [Exiguobacterium sp. R-39]|uniref:hypothetical protein n=1 Tax=Exiguobacterium sp. R-39 TaxID=3416708 RepID=UPI003CF7B620